MSAYPMGWHSTDLGGGRACNVPVWSMRSVSASEFPAWWAAHWRMRADLETKLFAGYEPVADLPAPRAADPDSIPGLLAAARERMGRE